MVTLDQLPTEVLLRIGQFVDSRPNKLVNLLAVCKKFYCTFRTMVYRDIWAIVSSDEFFDTQCSTEKIRDYITSSGGVAEHDNNTVVTSVCKLKKLVSLLLDNEEIRSLVKSLKLNGLKFDPGDRETGNKVYDYMRSLPEGSYTKQSHRVFIHKEYLESMESQIFESSMMEFFQTSTKRANIGDYATMKKNISDMRELEEIGRSSNEQKGVLMDIDRNAVTGVLFCPHSYDEVSRKYGYLQCIQGVRQLLQLGLCCDVSLLTLQNMMMQSSLGTPNPHDELVFLSFMHYEFNNSFLCV